jgi:hypothetical protein
MPDPAPQPPPRGKETAKQGKDMASGKGQVARKDYSGSIYFMSYTKYDLSERMNAGKSRNPKSENLI